MAIKPLKVFWTSSLSGILCVTNKYRWPNIFDVPNKISIVAKYSKNLTCCVSFKVSDFVDRKIWNITRKQETRDIDTKNMGSKWISKNAFIFPPNIAEAPGNIAEVLISHDE